MWWTFLIVLYMALVSYGLYNIIKRRRFLSINKNILQNLDIQHYKVSILVDFLSWYNKMGLRETKKILMPKYIKGMEKTFKNVWKNM